MSDRIKSLLFAVILCFVCSILLTTASAGLQRFQARNVLIDKQKNILKAVGLVEEGKRYSPQEIETLFQENIKQLWVDQDGSLIDGAKRGEADVPVYLQTDGQDIAAYILPIDSRGLWGRIKGYLAIENDGSTVVGFTVYKHSETPGLGGEIENTWFQKNWVGKKIVDQGGDLVSVGIAKGRVEDAVPQDKRDHYVDGISGATLTGMYLTDGIKEILEDYEPVSIKFRKKRVKGSTGPQGLSLQ